jgi:hypothetical protein
MAADLSRQHGLHGGPPDRVVTGRVAEKHRRAWDIPGPSTFGALAALTGTALALVATACGGGETEADRAAAPPPVPHTLADGSVPVASPEAPRNYRGRPVLVAKALSPRSATLRTCPPDPTLRGPTLAGAWVSTDGLSVGYYARGTPPLWACDAARIRGRLRPCSRAASPSRDPDRLVRAGGSVGMCGGRRIAFMWIAAPAKARWALVDHESYWTAYRSPRSRLLRISGTKGVNPQGSFRPRVAFLAATGDVLRVETIQGFVAG